MARSASYPSPLDVLRDLKPSYPVMCLRPAVFRARAAAFLTGFPGRVLYAVKCNPQPSVLRSLYGAGVRGFDAASLPEIAQVAELLPEPECFFHHPVKGRAAIHSAYRVYGVRHFTVDHADELQKVLEETRAADLVIHVRFATPPAQVSFDLSAKFGATPAEAAQLLAAAAGRGLAVGLSFHVGSQCLAPDAYDVALRLAETVLDDAGVPLGFLNVGGGFPADYPGLEPPALEDYFQAIRAGLARLDLPAGCEVLCEPGRALVADGCSLLLQVQLRRGERLYVNDGVYGSLSDLHWTKGLNPPVRLLRPHGPVEAPTSEAFTIYGPTCDSLDVLPLPWRLPPDVREGDWIEVGQMGAYSTAVSTNFNGLRLETFVEVEEPPFHWR
jgi:ornithine decarboxylase